jgi:hypothetical protein
MLPILNWGSQAWHFIHVVALSYPDKPSNEDKENYKKFFDSLKYALPCPICREGYKENIKKIPIRLDSKRELFNWTVDIHNEVNKKNDKRVLSYEEAYEETLKNGAPKEELSNLQENKKSKMPSSKIKDKTNHKPIILISLILVTGLIGYNIFRKKE